MTESLLNAQQRNTMSEFKGLIQMKCLFLMIILVVQGCKQSTEHGKHIIVGDSGVERGVEVDVLLNSVAVAVSRTDQLSGLRN